MGKPQRTVRLRFTVLYASLFLVSGIGLLVLTNLFTVTAPADFPEQLEVVRARQLLAGSLIALGVMLVVSVLLGRFVAGRVLRPLRTITAATRRITAENLHERLAVPGPADEVKHLADTIDDLLERLEASFAAQRRFVANASHELRTPLATMRASLDVAEAKPEPRLDHQLAERFRTELDRVDQLLEGLLALARVQHGAFADQGEVSLRDLVTEALRARETDIAAKDLKVERELGESRVHGSPALLSRLVANVLDNAIVHNERGGWIRVTTGDNGFEVETGGAVLDQADVDRLADPFRRLAADRTTSDGGSGLGLSIVAAIAEAHGRRLRLKARSDGGLRVTV
ncbi:HAMP domain-containing sensor histidine kinase [Amycolatopsis sp. YIM 10]|uniref:sensor histidine kinase n=1 Tax=Amycolatopsis sp. YIM 10 TaxID=2653857 RepID=UPI00128FD7C8|nr:HAMP domain-containing sensor histidine kinase [Amycolatopsis sp. YIM 10]QFU92124.1 Signal transduction histidine-protein kinase ArlS [Amycolatopsis sp. YIM 10]